MGVIKHKMFGVGEVVSRENKENGSYITVTFKNGRTMKFAIPKSFETGLLVAEEALQEEVNEAISKKNAQERAELQDFITAHTVVCSPSPSSRRGRIPASSVAVKGSIEIAFEKYLKLAGYKEISDAGNPSTIFSYVNAIKRVLLEEGMSWFELQNNIDAIIPLYDVWGVKAHIGAASNFTVINALRRFDEMVNG